MLELYATPERIATDKDLYISQNMFGTGYIASIEDLLNIIPPKQDKKES